MTTLAEGNETISDASVNPRSFLMRNGGKGCDGNEVAWATQIEPLKFGGSKAGIELLDHIIFNRTGYYSFLEAGTL